VKFYLFNSNGFIRIVLNKQKLIIMKIKPNILRVAYQKLSPISANPKSLICFILFFFCSLSLICETRADPENFTITEPQRASTLPKCVPIKLSWNTYNGNTDAYKVKITYSGTSDLNDDGLPETQLNYVVLDTILWEESWWGSKPYEVYFTVNGKFMKGACTATVQPTRRYQGDQGTGVSFNYIVVDNNILSPPLPFVKLICSRDKDIGSLEEIEANISDPANYDIVWWDALSGGNRLYTGRKYTTNIQEGLTIFYISKIDKKGCYLPSLRVPVAVFLIPNDIYNNVPGFDLNQEIQPEPDPRLNTPYCTKQGTYYDLPRVPPIPSVGGLPGFIEVKISSPNISWRDKNYYDTNLYRVCNSNLPPEAGSSRVYFGKAVYDFELILKDPSTGDFLASSKQSCSTAEKFKVTVSKSRTCSSNLVEATTIYNTNSNDCGKTNSIPNNLCSNYDVVIGPSNAEYPPFPQSPNPALQPRYEYKWINNTAGLSATNIRNPSVKWSQVPVNAGQYYLYKLEVTTVTPFIRNNAPSPADLIGENRTTEIYCNYVFKCYDCGNSAKGIESDSAAKAEPFNNYLIDSPSLSWKVYPNPVKQGTELNIELSDPSSATIELYNIMGQQMRILKTNGESLLGMDVQGLEKGTYIMILKTKDKVPQQRKIIIQ
jgi:hypothetical protein